MLAGALVIAGVAALPTAAGQAQYSTSPARGTIVFSSNRAGHFSIYLISASGRQVDSAGNDAPVRLTNSATDDVEPSWSPDGSRIVFVRNVPTTSTSSGVQGDIWIMSSDGSGQQALSADTASEHNPSFSPDGSQITYRRDGEIWLMGADGSNPHPITYRAQADQPSFSPDGTQISFVSTRQSKDPVTGAALEQVYTVPVAACSAAPCTASQFNPLTVSPGQGGGPCPATPDAANTLSDNRFAGFSPGGATIIFTSTRCASRTGKDIFVMDSATGAALTDVTPTPGDDRMASWSPDGQGFVFSSDRDAGRTASESLYVARADGTRLRRLTNHKGQDVNAHWWAPPLPAVSGEASAAATPPPFSLLLRGAQHQDLRHRAGTITVRVRCNRACGVRLRARGRVPGSRVLLRFSTVRLTMASRGVMTASLHLAPSQFAALAARRYGPAGRRVPVDVVASGRSAQGEQAFPADRHIVVTS